MTRVLWVGTALTLVACFDAELTDFYEEPSAFSVSSGGSENAESGSGGVLIGSAGNGASASTDASGGTGNGSNAEAGTSAAASSAGTAATAGTGADTSGGTSSQGGEAGAAPGSGGTGTGTGEGGYGGEVSCAAYGETAADFNGHCYLFVEETVTWRSASDACKERGAHLVTLSSEGRTQAAFQAENTFVWTLAGMTPVWIAATDGKNPHQPGDGTYYEWTNGEAMTYDNWSSSQPNNSSAACQDDRPCSCDESTCYEHCGFQWANAGKDGTVPGWNDRLCEHEIAYVCEWDEP